MNIDIFYFLNNFALQYLWLDKTIVFFAAIFGILLVLAAAFFLLFHHDKSITGRPFISIKQRIGETIIVFVAAGGAWVLAHLIKSIFETPRPFLLLKDVNLLLDYGGFDSFPSGHAMFFAALATSLFFYHKKFGIFFGIGAVLIGIARVIAGIHFPMDILAGYILGIAFAWVVYKLLKI